VNINTSGYRNTNENKDYIHEQATEQMQIFLKTLKADPAEKTLAHYK
jgi:hypothetical protein